MRVNECDMASILMELRQFQYTTDVDGTPTTVNVTLWESGMNYIVTQAFLQKHGRLKADDILEMYKNGDVNKDYVGDCLKILLVNQWKHWLECWKSDYNPIWNVDGEEIRTIETKYGKISTTQYGSTLTDEQKVNGSVSMQYGKTSTLTDEQKVNGTVTTQYGKIDTLTDEQKVNGTVTTQYGQTIDVADEQKTDGKNNTTHGKKIDHTNPTTTNQVAAFDQNTYVGHDQQSITATYDQESGTTNTAISMGKITHDTDFGGSDTVTNNLGKVEHKDELSGSDTVTNNIGKMEHKQEDRGTDTQTNNMGKVEHAKAGNDALTNSGKDEVTETLVRHGNIGVTMTQQLLTAEKNFWEYFNFFDMFFQSIANELSIPIYE